MASPQQAESSKRPSQPINTNEEISVDDVRARLIQGRAKQSPSSTIEHSLPDDASPNNQTTNETDQWTVYKKKNRPRLGNQCLLLTSLFSAQMEA
jgi:hypothetical protein